MASNTTPDKEADAVSSDPTTTTSEPQLAPEHSELTAAAIETGRYERACLQAPILAVVPTPDAGGLVDVAATGDGSETDTYRVDLATGACTCPDCEYRGLGCKHLLRASLVALIDPDQRVTRTVAQVARFAAEHGCPTDNDSRCDGPLGPRLPCPACMDATRCAAAEIDEYDVWLAAVQPRARTRDREQEQEQELEVA
jgi:hypothetical protein